MILIRDPDHIAQIANPHLQDFLRQRLSALADHGFYTPDLHGYMIIVEPGDNADEIASVTDFHILRNWVDGHRFPDCNFVPSFDFMEELEHCYELGVCLNDDGFTILVIILKQPDIDNDILAMCKMFTSPITLVS